MNLSNIQQQSRKEYYLRIRLQKAGSMLLTDYLRPVTEVAALCGFNSTAVFCRTFKTHFGKSTGDFRSPTHLYGGYLCAG